MKNQIGYAKNKPEKRCALSYFILLRPCNITLYILFHRDLKTRISQLVNNCDDVKPAHKIRSRFPIGDRLKYLDRQINNSLMRRSYAN